jgi:hypothetical protein
MKFATLSKLGDKLNNLPTDKTRIQVCLFIINNALSHTDNYNAIQVGGFCHGYLRSLLVRYDLNDFDTTDSTILKQMNKIKVLAHEAH